MFPDARCAVSAHIPDSFMPVAERGRAPRVGPSFSMKVVTATRLVAVGFGMGRSRAAFIRTTCSGSGLMTRRSTRTSCHILLMKWAGGSSLKKESKRQILLRSACRRSVSFRSRSFLLPNCKRCAGKSPPAAREIRADSCAPSIRVARTRKRLPGPGYPPNGIGHQCGVRPTPLGYPPRFPDTPLRAHDINDEPATRC